MRRAALAVVVCAVAALAAGMALSATHPARITVYAAASLTNALPAIEHETYSFGGSNDLATQIRQGAPADVFASANVTLPDELHHDGLCTKPLVFTRNRLVIVVPAANPAHIRAIHDLTKPGVKVDVAAAGVPVGDYSRRVLRKLGLTAAVMANVVSEESDVREVLSKVALGEVDAGFVYATDAKTVPRQVRAIALPARGQPTVRYGICIVRASTHEADAQAFVTRVLGEAGQKKLRAYGFLPR